MRILTDKEERSYFRVAFIGYLPVLVSMLPLSFIMFDSGPLDYVLRIHIWWTGFLVVGAVLVLVSRVRILRA